jgi:hypothetical protein
MTRLALKEDHTTTGGRVLGGSADQYAEDGRPFALDGDKATCGNCKGLWPLLGSAHDWMDQGRSMVKDLDPIHCPCGKNRVFASGNSPFDYETGGIGEPIQQQSPPEQTYDQHFHLLNTDGRPIVGLPYMLKSADGKVVRGVTSSTGHTEKLESDGPHDIAVSLDL